MTQQTNGRSWPDKGLNWLYDLFTGDDEDTRVCKDIPDQACRHQPRNFFAYLSANVAGKIADELASARLTLPWLMSALGAPGSLAAFLVPIREAGVLLPQLVVAAYIRRLARRKVVWLLGAGLSALAMFLMALVAVSASGAAAGWAILALLVLYSLARGLCSVSAKDVLGKTVSRTRRGALMGYSVAISGTAVLLLGVYVLQSGGHLVSEDLFFGLLLGATGCWLLGSLAFKTIRETPGATEGGGNALRAAWDSLGLLRSDRHFRRFVILRALLLSVALMPPFLVIAAQSQTANGLSGLGGLLVANSLAAALSAVVWGKLSDRSSRWVMMIGASLAALVGVVSCALLVSASPWLAHPMLHAGLFFLLAVAHSGVRLGRKVYLVDMASTQLRSSYVAVSNTVIGVVMLLAGSIGLLADWLGLVYAIALLSALALAAALYAWRIPAAADVLPERSAH